MEMHERGRLSVVITAVWLLFVASGCGAAPQAQEPMTEPTRWVLETAQAGDIHKLSATLSAPSATPLPTATAVPTGTPTPRPAPTQVPTSTATPPKQVLTPEEIAALDAMGVQTGNLSDGLLSLRPLMLNAKFGDEQWRMLVLAAMLKIRTAYVVLSQQNVPPRLQAYQSAVLRATSDCNSAMDFLAQGIDTAQPAAIQQATALISSCGAKLGPANEALVRLRQGF